MVTCVTCATGSALIHSILTNKKVSYEGKGLNKVWNGKGLNTVGETKG